MLKLLNRALNSGNIYKNCYFKPSTNLLFRGFRTLRRDPTSNVQQVKLSKSPKNPVFPYLITATVGSGVIITGCTIWEMKSTAHRQEKWMRIVSWDGSYLIGEWSLADNAPYLAILALNFGIFVLFRVRPITAQRMCILKLDSKHPIASHFLSMFSHYSLLHFGLNMFVLHNFWNVMSHTYSAPQLVSIYLCGGLWSGVGSIAYKSLQMAAAARKGLRFSGVGSLGASGSIIAMFSVFATHNPDARMAIALFSEIWPHAFTATNAQIGLATFDTLGLLYNAKFGSVIDHSAHLSGLLFGYLYAKYCRVIRQRIANWYLRWKK